MNSECQTNIFKRIKGIMSTLAECLMLITFAIYLINTYVYGNFSGEAAPTTVHINAIASGIKLYLSDKTFCL